MTAVSDVQAGPDIWERRPVLVVCIITYAALMLASFANLLDPMIRHDDFPALLAAPDGYYIKTLEEGRWVNYLWHLRDFTPPAWVNFTLYQVLWAVFGAALAVTARGLFCRSWTPLATFPGTLSFEASTEVSPRDRWTHAAAAQAWACC